MMLKNLSRTVETILAHTLALVYDIDQKLLNKIMGLNNKVLVGTHHKTGIVWMESIFSQICQKLGFKFFKGKQSELSNNFDIFFQNHSLFDFKDLQTEYRGLHLIRDPRDIIVSGCFYHQKSQEQWLHINRDKFGGLTYQEKINSYDLLDDKIMFEMENSASYTIQEILDWNYNNPAFYEIKYEEIILDENMLLFQNIFTFLGFYEQDIPDIIKNVYDNSLFSNNFKKDLYTHIRSGKPRQWKNILKPRHKTRFIELYGDTLIKLGYERNHDWVNSELTDESLSYLS